VERVVRAIEPTLIDGMSTGEIYRKAFATLRATKKNVAVRYNLRNAIAEMGPSGFAFEKFVGRIMEAKGHKVRTGVMAKGWCSEHEIDVSARKDGGHTLIECKFHNHPNIKTDLKIALYVQARFEDIEKLHEHDNAEGSRYHEAWLVTNTKLTSMAINYGKCIGLRTVGWNYPEKGNLEDLIIETGVNPITALISLSKREKKALLEKHIVECKDLERKPHVLKEIGVGQAKKARIFEEMKGLCQIG
jgi:hypothetical protein